MLVHGYTRSIESNWIDTGVFANLSRALAALRRGGMKGLFNTREEAASIKVPMLMIFGTLDAVDAGKEMQAILPSARLVTVDGATHGGERGAARRPEFIAAVRQFIADHP